MRATILITALLLGSGMGATAPAQQTVTSEPVRNAVDHGVFTDLLSEYVDTEGDVDYQRLSANANESLGSYLTQLAAARPSRFQDRAARLAFWINAYNALTLKLIIDHYPVRSIQNIPGPEENRTPFERPVGVVADTIRTLDEIEHQIIRERFDEPRIHFALVCAAKSCPQLRTEAFTGPRLDRQLDEQARRFLHNERKNRIPAKEGVIALSPIFDWYGQDFAASPTGIQRALARYFESPIRDRLEQAAYDVRYLPYDWTLNDQALEWGDEGTAPSL